jgi:hypothetical protein
MSAFAALEATVNASVLQHLANARVRIAGDEVDGIFTNPAQLAALGAGAADTRPSVVIAAAAVPADPVDQFIEIDGVPYVIGAADPDGTGMTRLIVERTQ